MKNKFIIETKYTKYFNIISDYFKGVCNNSNIKVRFDSSKGCNFLIYNENSGNIVAKNTQNEYVAINSGNIKIEFDTQDELVIIYEPKSIKCFNNVKVETKLRLIPNIVSDLINNRFEISKLFSVFKTRLNMLDKYYLYVYSESGIIISGHLKEDSEFHTYNNDKISELGLSKY